MERGEAGEEVPEVVAEIRAVCNRPGARGGREVRALGGGLWRNGCVHFLHYRLSVQRKGNHLASAV